MRVSFSLNSPINAFKTKSSISEPTFFIALSDFVKNISSKKRCQNLREPLK
jgi:hypothetical protein